MLEPTNRYAQIIFKKWQVDDVEGIPAALFYGNLKGLSNKFLYSDIVYCCKEDNEEMESRKI